MPPIRNISEGDEREKWLQFREVEQVQHPLPGKQGDNSDSPGEKTEDDHAQCQVVPAASRSSGGSMMASSYFREANDASIPATERNTVWIPKASGGNRRLVTGRARMPIAWEIIPPSARSETLPKKLRACSAIGLLPKKVWGCSVTQYNPQCFHRQVFAWSLTGWLGECIFPKAMWLNPGENAMDFQWMEGVEWLKRIKDAVAFRHRMGDICCHAPGLGIVPPPPSDRRPGISVMMRLKNEAQWIESALRSLAPFAEQFSIVDNGSTDGTPEIVERVARELGLDYALERLPTEDFGEVCDRALRNTTCQWVLRWDGDMIARTSGPVTLHTIREYIFSLPAEPVPCGLFPPYQNRRGPFSSGSGLSDPPRGLAVHLFARSPASPHRAVSGGSLSPLL